MDSGIPNDYIPPSHSTEEELMDRSLMRFVLACTFAAGCAASPVDEPQAGDAEPANGKSSIFAACPGSQGAGVEVTVAAQTCEQEYGATNIRSKHYQIP